MTATGDTFSNIQPIENGSYLDIKPESGQEARIHNIYYNGKVEFYFGNGTDNIKYDSDSTATGGARMENYINVTSTNYVRVKNVADSGSILIGYDGIYTKV